MERSLYLFGVAHEMRYFDQQIAAIEATVGDIQGKVLMLELAPNYDEAIRKKILRPSFFTSMREHFKDKCSEILCGDQELTLPDHPVDEAELLVAMCMGERYFWPDNRRDEVMINNIHNKKPDIFIAGNGHTDEIRRVNWRCLYTVFKEKGQSHQWYKPDRVITLE